MYSVPANPRNKRGACYKEAGPNGGFEEEALMHGGLWVSFLSTQSNPTL